VSAGPSMTNVGYDPKIGMSQWEHCHVLDNVEDMA